MIPPRVRTLRLDHAEAVKIELPSEGGEVGVREELGQNLFGESLRILDINVRTVVAPGEKRIEYEAAVCVSTKRRCV